MAKHSIAVLQNDKCTCRMPRVLYRFVVISKSAAIIQLMVIDKFISDKRMNNIFKTKLIIFVIIYSK